MFRRSIPLWFTLHSFHWHFAIISEQYRNQIGQNFRIVYLCLITKKIRNFKQIIGWNSCSLYSLLRHRSFLISYPNGLVCWWSNLFKLFARFSHLEKKKTKSLSNVYVLPCHAPTMVLYMWSKWPCCCSILFVFFFVFSVCPQVCECFLSYAQTQMNPKPKQYSQISC